MALPVCVCVCASLGSRKHLTVMQTQLLSLARSPSSLSLSRLSSRTNRKMLLLIMRPGTAGPVWQWQVNAGVCGALVQHERHCILLAASLRPSFGSVLGQQKSLPAKQSAPSTCASVCRVCVCVFVCRRGH